MRLPADAGAGFGAQTILAALKLLMSAVGSGDAGEGAPGIDAVEHALSVAQLLADLCASGLPLDADVIAAGILAGAYCSQRIDPAQVAERLGPAVTQLLHDVHRVHTAPQRVDLSDDHAASGLRELCLSFYDVRAIVVETAVRLELMRRAGSLPLYQQQLEALECLQVYAPLGHAIGVGKLSAGLEDMCFRILFPKSYEETARWLQTRSGVAETLLDSCREQLQRALASNAEFSSLAGDILLRGRTKSLFSTMKKLLRLEEPSKGGRKRGEVYDYCGVRAIVLPREDGARSEAAAETDAVRACYVVQEVAHSLWDEVPGRSKDYIRQPKPNGYQSLHSTVMVPAADGRMQPLELQVRTNRMDRAAEEGAAAHAAYKGGLHTSQARKLKRWTEKLLAARAMPAEALSKAASVTSTWEVLESGAEELFRQLDVDGDGVISATEVDSLLEDLGVSSVDAADGRTDGIHLLSFGEKSGDDSLTFEDFLRFRTQAAVIHGLPVVDQDFAAVLRGRSGSEPEEEGGGEPAEAPPDQAAAEASGSPPASPPVRHRGPPLARAAAAAPLAVARSASWGLRLRLRPRARALTRGRCSIAAFAQSRATEAELMAHDGRASPAADDAEEEGGSGIDREHGGDELPERKPLRPSMPAAPAQRGGVSRRAPAERPKLALVPEGDVPIVPDQATRLVSWIEGDERVAGLVVPEAGPMILGALSCRGCDAVVDIETVSGLHARLERVPGKAGGAVMVTDLSSTNGTYVNGVQLQPNHDAPAHEGDLISLSRVGFRIQRLPEGCEGIEIEGAAVPPGLPFTSLALRCAEDIVAADAQAKAGRDEQDGEDEADTEAAALDSGEAEEGGVSDEEDSVPAGERLHEMLKELWKQGQVAAARHLFLLRLRRNPTDGVLWARWAFLEGTLNDPPEGAGVVRIFYRAATEALAEEFDEETERLGCNKKLVRALRSWGIYEFRSGQQVSARRLLRRAVDEAQLHPDGLAAEEAQSTLHRWAKEERRRGKTRQAMSLADEGLSAAPTNPYLLQLKGSMLGDSGHIGAAETVFDRGLRANPRFTGLMHAWAVLKASLKDIDGARQLFKQLLKMDPNNIAAIQAWAVAEAKCKRVNQSRTLFQLGVAKHPDSVLCWHAWGRMELGIGNIEKARQLYEKALSLDPSNVHTMVSLGYLERNFGDLAAARELLERADGLQPKNPAVLQELGYLVIAEGDRERGKALMKLAERENTRQRALRRGRRYVPVRYSREKRMKKQWWKTQSLKRLGLLGTEHDRGSSNNP